METICEEAAKNTHTHKIKTDTKDRETNLFAIKSQTKHKIVSLNIYAHMKQRSHDMSCCVARKKERKI